MDTGRRSAPRPEVGVGLGLSEEEQAAGLGLGPRRWARPRPSRGASHRPPSPPGGPPRPPGASPAPAGAEGRGRGQSTPPGLSRSETRVS